MDRLRHARLQWALKDFHTLNTANQWARLVVDGQLIVLQLGPIHTDGSQECMTKERFYTWVGEKGVQVYDHTVRS